MARRRTSNLTFGPRAYHTPALTPNTVFPLSLRYTRLRPSPFEPEVTYGILQFLRRNSECRHKVLQQVRSRRPGRPSRSWRDLISPSACSSVFSSAIQGRQQRAQNYPDHHRHYRWPRHPDRGSLQLLRLSRRQKRSRHAERRQRESRHPLRLVQRKRSRSDGQRIGSRRLPWSAGTESWNRLRYRVRRAHRDGEVRERRFGRKSLRLLQNKIPQRQHQKLRPESVQHYRGRPGQLDDRECAVQWRRLPVSNRRREQKVLQLELADAR